MTTLTWPLKGGARQYPITRDSQGHIDDGQEAAVDLACPQSVPCEAVHEAEVTQAGLMGACGIAVELAWVEGETLYAARYCHLSARVVHPGDIVAGGQVIGYSGSTGQFPDGTPSATGPHLHLAMWVDGVRVHPEDYLLSPPEAAFPLEDSMNEERIAALEAQLAYYGPVIDKLAAIVNPDNGNIRTPGNLYMVGPREDGDPIKLFMGPDDDRGLYLSLDRRDPAEGTEWMAKVETFIRPFDGVPVASGYGAIPLRVMGMLGVDELNGVTARRYVVAEQIYLGRLKHRHPETGDFVHADHYDAKGVPWGDAGETVMLGGAYWDQENPGVLLTAEDVGRLKDLLV